LDVTVGGGLEPPLGASDGFPPMKADSRSIGTGKIVVDLF
jgi:hypothetical protein